MYLLTLSKRGIFEGGKTEFDKLEINLKKKIYSMQQILLSMLIESVYLSKKRKRQMTISQRVVNLLKRRRQEINML